MCIDLSLGALAWRVSGSLMQLRLKDFSPVSPREARVTDVLSKLSCYLLRLQFL